MQYRQFGNKDLKVSALGFGAMRLPTVDGQIDESTATQMVHQAVDSGVNYIDTAWPYHGGESERFLGRALKGGYREKVTLATKMPRWDVEKAEDFEKIFQQQLSKLQTDWIDCYMIHGLNAEAWKRVRDLGVIEWSQKKIASGEMKYFGFSFHSTCEDLKYIIDDYDGWDMCMVQYNYMDIQRQAGQEGVRYAHKKDLPVVAMEPLLGGKLSWQPPEAVQKVWDKAETSRSPVEWAFRWLWNQPEISVVLSGMSSPEQLEENLAIASKEDYDQLSETEKELVKEAREAHHGLCPIPCTTCDYCQPCPEGVKIPKIFSLYNEAYMYNNIENGKKRYQKMPEEQKISHCSECRQCEKVCPQGIAVVDWLKKVEQEFGQA